MKTLLVPTDFSSNARNALDYAVALANRFDSKILLYHAFKTRITSRTFISIDSILKEEAEEKMEAISEEVKKDLIGNASIQGLAMRGDVIPAIQHRAAMENADLIVMGTEGASGIRGIVMGSTAVGVLESVEVPVLVVPKGAIYKGFESLVIALDEKAVSSPEVLRPLFLIARAYDLAIKVYHKTDPQHPSELDEQVAGLFNDIPHGFYYETNEMDANESILQYARHEMADLLCLVRRKRNFLEKLFETSITRQQVLHGNLPMLILKE
jgi:nucleotide-binding universal stress UspA family protein